MSKISNVGDLTQMAKEIEAVFNKHFNLTEEPASIAIAFSLPNDYSDVHWKSNARIFFCP